ncbi:hypothetical protein H6G96_28780 [Nostoc sp. FACHB-892]|nr:hypothetical protein [Nostoc sp. FACHB-892]
MVSKPNIRRAIALRQIKYFSLRCGQFMAEKTVTLWCKSHSPTCDRRGCMLVTE